MEKQKRSSNKRNKYPRYNMSTYAEFETDIEAAAKALGTSADNKADVIRRALQDVIKRADELTDYGRNDPTE